MTDSAEHAGEAAVAAQLLAAHRRLAAADVPAEARLRLHRRLMAVSEAVKSPGADPATVGRRLAAFIAALEQECAENSAHRISKASSRPS